MDLKAFVSEALCQIQEGVEEAIQRREASNGGGIINPRFSQYIEDTKDIVEKVTFDVAVTASESAEKSGQGGLKVWGIGVNAEAKGTKDHQVVSRIQFSVPIAAPYSVIEQDRTAAEAADRERRLHAAQERMRLHNEAAARRRY